MSRRNVHCAPCRLYLYTFSLSAALHFLSLRKIVYFENIFFIFLCQKTFLPVWNHQWRVRLIILLVCTSVPLVYLNVLWIIKGIKALGWEEERGAEVQRVSWQCTWGSCDLSIPCTSLWGCSAPWGCCSSAGGEPGLGAWVCPEAAVLPGTWGVWIIYASIKDLWKWNWGPAPNCMRLHL